MELIKVCKDAGVSYFTDERLGIRFGFKVIGQLEPRDINPPTVAHYVENPVNLNNNENEDSESDMDIQELMLTDPLAYERLVNGESPKDSFDA